MSAVNLTKIQIRALKGLSERGGSGAIDKLGRVVASGEVVGTHDDEERLAAFSPATWLILFSLSMIEPDGPRRLKLTAAAEQAVREA